MQSRETIAANFQKLGFNASREWFDQCFQWCQQENTTASRQKLLEAVKGSLKKPWYIHKKVPN